MGERKERKSEAENQASEKKEEFFLKDNGG